MESDQMLNEYEGEDHLYMRRVMQPNECEEVFTLIENDFKHWDFTKFKAYSTIFPSSIFVTIHKDKGEIVAAVSSLPSRPGQYNIGVLIVRPDFRLKGLASAMVDHVIQNSAHQPATFVLFSNPGLDNMYRNMGFQATTPIFYVVSMTHDKDKLHKAVSNCNTDDIKIARYTPEMFQALNDYDTELRGYDIKNHITVQTEISNFLLAISKSTGRIVGYVTCQKTRAALKIGGFFADGDTIAIQLLSKLVEAFPDKTPIELMTANNPEFLTQFCNETPPVIQDCTRLSTGNTTCVCLSKEYAMMDYTE